MQAGVLGIAITLLAFKPSDFVVKLGLTAISVLVGITFVVFGQIYQTGADAYDLFLGWTLFVTAWVAIASFPFLWFFYLLLINLTIVLYLLQVQMIDDDLDVLCLVVALVNTIALSIWEYAIKGNRANWVHGLLTKIIGVVVISALTITIVWTIFDYRTNLSLSLLKTFFYFGVIIGGSSYYIKKGKDIGFIALLSISVLVVGNSWIIDLSENYNKDEFLLPLSIGNIVLTITLVRILIRINKTWSLEAKEDSNNKSNPDYDGEK